MPKLVFNAARGLGAVGAVGRHNSRAYIAENVDEERSHLNRFLVPCPPDTSIPQRVEQLVKQHYKGTRAVRKDAVTSINLVISASPEYFRPGRKNAAGEYDLARVEAFEEAVMDWVGAKPWKTAFAITHLDETTPHLHLTLVPITADGMLRARAYVDGPPSLAMLHTELARHLQSHGLDIDRGRGRGEGGRRRPQGEAQGLADQVEGVRMELRNEEAARDAAKRQREAEETAAREAAARRREAEAAARDARDAREAANASLTRLKRKADDIQAQAEDEARRAIEEAEGRVTAAETRLETIEEEATLAEGRVTAAETRLGTLERLWSVIAEVLPARVTALVATACRAALAGLTRPASLDLAEEIAEESLAATAARWEDEEGWGEVKAKLENCEWGLGHLPAQQTAPAYAEAALKTQAEADEIEVNDDEGWGVGV